MDEIRQTLDRVNQAWLSRRFDDLNDLFDEGIAMKGPGLKDLVRGRTTLIASYADFMARSEVLAYEESNHFTERWGHTAAAGFDWTMTWRQGEKTETARGQDMFVFERHDDRWVAVLRIMGF